ncbi:unnamed protein product [Ascophyllum nodosum]
MADTEMKASEEPGKKEVGMMAKVEALIEDNPVLVMATSTCPFCIEAKRTLKTHGITSLFVDMDKEPNTSAMRKAMTALAANRTSVPQIWIKKEHIGGCDDLKALDATGDLGVKLEGLYRMKTVADAEAGSPAFEKVGGISADSAAVTTYPGPNAAYFSPFHSPTTVDHRVVRVNGVITFVVAVMTAVFAQRDVTEWVVLGLFVDFGLKLTGLPSPIGMIAALPFAGTKPVFSAGPSKQFANLCGIFMACLAWAFLLGDEPIVAQIFLGMLAAAAFLQGFLDFCLGCVIFELLLKYGLVSRAVYRLHVNTRADTVYAWEKNNVRTGKGVPPDAITYPTKGLPSNPTDLRAKPGKEDEKWERFHVIKYCHMSYFMVPLSILGLALPWEMLSETVGTASGPWHALAWAGVVLHLILLLLYLGKVILYHTKVVKEFNHPLHRSTFALPFLNFILISWLITKWTSADFSADLAKVFFWLGTAPLAVMTLFVVARQAVVPVDEEYVNPGWMLMPVGNLAGAVAARPVDEEYVEWGWFLFSVGVLLWLALWPITFRKAISNHHSDIRLRNLYSVWVAPPAVAMLAYASLEELDVFDPVQRLLFYASLCMALVLGWCIYPLDFFVEGKFDMSAWMFAFPLDATAAAAVVAYRYTEFDTMQVIYAVALALASLVNAVNILQTTAALIAAKIFIPAAKWSPLSFMKLSHEASAFREAVPKLNKLARAAKPGLSHVSTVRELATYWSAFSKAHDIHATHEEAVIFPELEAFFPGQTQSVSEEHEEQEKLAASIQKTIDTLLGGDCNDDSTRAGLLNKLIADLDLLGREVLEHLDHEEHSFATPVARKYLPVSIAKKLTRNSWEVTSNADMSEFLAFVMTSLRARPQRTRFLKTWVWAMPERAQQLGLMVYRVVDDVTWVEIARDLPEVVPRGLPGYRRYF